MAENVKRQHYNKYHVRFKVGTKIYQKVNLEIFFDIVRSFILILS
jgi:hypothetical protein